MGPWRPVPALPVTLAESRHLLRLSLLADQVSPSYLTGLVSAVGSFYLHGIPEEPYYRVPGTGD